jgi:HD-GYP domain-containing protein (c-di-GMP phosphodiesterase class II)
MTTDGDRGIYLRFAACSFLVVALAAAVLAYATAGFDRAGRERAAAQSTANTLAAPIGRELDPAPSGDPSAEDIDQAAKLVQRLLSPSVVSVRVWSDQGTALLTDGGELPNRGTPLAGSLAWERIDASNGDRLFLTYARAGTMTVEVAETASALDTSIARGQLTIAIVTIIAALATFGLLQLSFRLCVKALRVRYRRLLYLYTVGDEIRSSLDLHEVVTQLARDATGLAGADYALVALFDDEAGELMLHATFDRGTNIVSHHQRAIDEWFVRRCVATNMTVVTLQNGEGYRQFLGDQANLSAAVHLLCVPVAMRGHVVGVVAVLRAATSRYGAFHPTNISQVQHLAGQAVTAIEQAQLFAKVRSHAAEIELSYDATLKALMAALEAKDQATEGHSERMAKLTVHLAKQMEVAEEHLIDIERGALLHDVGTIGVPDSILKKPEALNEGEWEAMRKHPLLASLMVSKIGFLENSMSILLYHHERYDGNGYPFGLTAERIPLEARIFSVVDAYDAMTSDRPYRGAMPHEVAIAEITQNAGTQFDPDVVAAFGRLLALRPELCVRTASDTGQAQDGNGADGAADHAA